mmetsp:Transcript_22297/g.50426  ORF Transcript_22297/g.50426 Transcript_22297/m.50426 type:complete len:362 (+) Transcript_22297:3-1088(+)
MADKTKVDKKKLTARECGNCGVREDGQTTLANCARCSLVAYCSRPCQVAHWKRTPTGHKQYCIPMAERMPVSDTAPKGKAAASEVMDKELEEAIRAADEDEAGAPEAPECTICARPLPSEADRCRYQICCGKVMCAICFETIEETSARILCAFCRSPEPLTESEARKRIKARISCGDFLAYDVAALELSLGRLWPQDLKASFKYRKKAADGGCADAQYNLGQALSKGPPNYGCAVDMTMAAYYFKLAARQGDMMSQHNIASMYGNGTGVPQSWSKAKKWFMRAARQGDPSAIAHVEMMHRRRLGVNNGELTDSMNRYRRAVQELERKSVVARSALLNTSDGGRHVSRSKGAAEFKEKLKKT